MPPAARCLSACVLAAALASGASQAALEFHTEAVCIDNGAVQDGMAGGLPVPGASCSYSVNRSGINRRVGDASAQAQAIGGVRSVGVDVSVDATLATALPPSSAPGPSPLRASTTASF
jgi:hypothetical protein